MAKKSVIETNKRRARLVAQYASRRAALKAKIQDRTVDEDERFMAVLQLAALPRNSAKTRLRNRCAITGRPRGYYRRFNMSRIALRELGSLGQVPGLVKSSW